MSLYVHEAGRYPAFMIKSSAFDVKLIGPFLRVLGQLPVHRGEADAADVLKVAEQALADGECVIIYPEGTATRDPDRWPMMAKTGVARLALESGAPVIPCAMLGTFDLMPSGKFIPRLRYRPGVRFGKPLDFSRYAGLESDRLVLRAVTDEIMYAIMALASQEYVDEDAQQAKERLKAEHKAERLVHASTEGRSGT